MQQQHGFHNSTSRLADKEFTLPAKRLEFVDGNSSGDAEEKVKKLTGEVAELKKGMLTALADVENMRTRMKKTAEDDKKFAVRSFAKGMLEVADCLEKALEAVPAEKREGNEELKSVCEGLEMIERVFLKALGEASITKFNPMGEKFDPENSSAVFEMPKGEGEAGVVGHVIKSGYNM